MTGPPSRAARPYEEICVSQDRYTANLPSVGIASFLKSPICEDFSSVDAEVAFLGVPYDVGTGYRTGARLGPRELRAYSVRYSAWGGKLPSGYWDIDAMERRLDGVRVVDCGDVDIAYYDFDANRRKITEAVATLVSRGALPVLAGGDHSITYPALAGFAHLSDLHIVQIDAHLDWVDEIAGVRYGSASPLRRAYEDLPFVTGMTQIGIRNLGVREHDLRDTLAAGSKVITRRQVREEGIGAVIDQLPGERPVYVTIDLDGLDPSIAPGVNGQSADGLLYHEVRDILAAVAARSRVVGFDVVELNPLLDHHGQTALLASQLMVEFLGHIFARRPRPLSLPAQADT